MSVLVLVVGIGLVLTQTFRAHPDVILVAVGVFMALWGLVQVSDERATEREQRWL